MKPLSVREMIIEVQQQVQRLNSFKRDQTHEQRIIWRLNSAQDLIVQDSIKPNPSKPDRFMIHEHARQSIQGLIRPNVKLPVHKETSTRSFAFLPSDLGFLVNDRSIVLEDCKEAFKEAPVPTTYTVTVLPLVTSPLTSGPYYRTVVARKTSGGNPEDETKTFNLASKNEKFEIVESVMDMFKEHGAFGVYWEKFEYLYFPDSILVVHQSTGDGTNIPSYYLVVDGVEGVRSTRAFTLDKFRAFNGPEKPNRSYQNDFVYDAMNVNYYEQPYPHSPVSQLSADRLFVFNSERFLVPEIIIDYIKKPRRISLYLNQTSELDGSVHQRICSRAAELLLRDIEAPNYGTKVQENINRIE